MTPETTRDVSLPCVGTYSGPPPVVHPETATFWHSLGQGRFLLQECGGCGHRRYPLAPVCWRCQSLEFEWVPGAVRGTVAVSTTIRRATGDPRWAAEVPYVIALADMDDGVRLPGRLLESGQLPRGRRIRLAYLTGPDGLGIHCFIPSEEDS